MHGAFRMAKKPKATSVILDDDGHPMDYRLADARGPTPERLEKAGSMVEIGGDERSPVRMVTLRDAPIERAKDRGVISERQYTAALKYRHHWWRAGLAGSLGSMDLNRIFASDSSSFSGMAKTEAQAFHRQQYRKAVEHVGIIGAAVIEQIVCNELAFEHAGRKLGWAARPAAIVAATERLRAALDDLVKLWGL